MPHTCSIRLLSPSSFKIPQVGHQVGGQVAGRNASGGDGVEQRRGVSRAAAQRRQGIAPLGGGQSP
jgi:hypothetical protein